MHLHTYISQTNICMHYLYTNTYYNTICILSNMKYLQCHVFQPGGMQPSTQHMYGANVMFGKWGWFTICWLTAWRKGTFWYTWMYIQQIFCKMFKFVKYSIWLFFLDMSCVCLCIWSDMFVFIYALICLYTCLFVCLFNDNILEYTYINACMTLHLCIFVNIYVLSFDTIWTFSIGLNFLYYFNNMSLDSVEVSKHMSSCTIRL